MKAAIMTGKPEPSFKDEDLPTGLPKHSAEASLFLCLLLDRDPSQRPNAEQALQNKWFLQLASAPSPDAASFRPTILKSLSTGAYDRTLKKVQEQTDLDVYLHQEQELHQRTEKVDGEYKRYPKKSPSLSLTNSTSSDVSSRSGFSSATSRQSGRGKGFMKSGTELQKRFTREERANRLRELEKRCHANQNGLEHGCFMAS